jgi:hypothetical protein
LEEKDKQVAILLTRLDELNQLKELCQMVQSKLDQQQREKQKAKEVEKQAAEENTPKSSSMSSNPPNHSDQLLELALKKLGQWPYEEPVQTIVTNVRQFLSRVSTYQLVNLILIIIFLIILN